MTNPVLVAVLGIAGACTGSWVATAALRSLRSEQAWVGRSRCDHCGISLGFAQTAPIVSYAALGGACSRCGGAIDRTHLMGEVVGAIVVAAPWAVLSPARAALVGALGLVLLGSSIVDARTGRLPDLLTAGAAALCFALSATAGAAAAMIGAVAAVAAFACLEGTRRVFAWLARKPGLGFGDVKLGAAVALWLGLSAPWAMVVACLAGLCFYGVARPKDGRIAFGPFIAAAAWLVGFGREAQWWLPSP